MKIFGFNIGKTYEPLVQNVTIPNTTKHSNFSTPFLEIGSGNLSTPYINKYYTQNNIVKFGADNLYPQILNQIYLTSALHGACIDYTSQAIIGGGYELNNKNLTAEEIVNWLTFEKVNKFKKLSRSITKDYIIHRRVCVVITKCEGKMTKIQRVDPSAIRNNIDLNKFVYSYDWSRGSVNLKEYRRYDATNPLNGEYLYVFQDETPGQDVYPIPRYNSILNWAYLDGEQSYFHKSNIENSIFPSLVVRVPYIIASDDDAKKLKDSFQKNKGVRNAGNAIVLSGAGFDNVPEVTTINPNSNDKLFVETAKELKDNICFGNSINPAIIGIKVAGSLGNNDELRMSYQIFEKNIVLSDRANINEILNDLIDACGIHQSVTITNFQLIDDVITDVTATPAEMQEDKGPKSITLKPKGAKDVEENTTVNDALKGLDAKSNMDLMRIIRDHSKGKLNDALAIARLKSYGISEDEAKDILDII